MTKRPSGNLKPATQTGKPETQHKQAKQAVPGSENSKAQSSAKDVRSGHDKDGNSEQRGH